MKRLEIRNIKVCPICGAEVYLRKNASKDFQVMCPGCGFKTGWKTKPDAIIEYYNMCDAVSDNPDTLKALRDAYQKGRRPKLGSE